MENKNDNKPINSLIGIGLFVLTLVTHLSFRFLRTRSNDVGLGMMLSLANAVFLVFTLLWSVLGIREFRLLLKSYQKVKNEMNQELISTDSYKNKIKIHKNNLTISIGYLVIVFIQLMYVIFNWDEVNV